jgi:FHS family L-fucose permease-like MFS transporter
MTNATVTEEANISSSSQKHKNYTIELISLTTLFFMWGFLTSLNDVLIPYLRNMFELSYTQAMLIQFCFFGAYFIVSIPAGALISRIGYQRGIVTGLIIACIGCLMFYPASSMGVYGLFLAALFVLASGITILQVAANPFVSVLGNPKTASSRLTLTQAFNSFGTTIAPILIGPLILAAIVVTASSTQSVAEQQAEAVQIPYLLLGAALLVLAIIFSYVKLPKIATKAEEGKSKDLGSAMQYPHLILGAVGIFVYVGAEVGIGSFLISFLSMDSIAGLEESSAAKYIGYYFGGAMVGRFIGAAAMQKIAAGKALAFNAAAAIVLVCVAMFTSGYLAMWAILLVGFCNSIMFPTIFSLAIHGLKEHTSQGSGILCLSIVGGAILPLLQGMLADGVGIQMAFFIPVVCYAYIVYYGLVGCKPKFPTKTSSVGKV